MTPRVLILSARVGSGHISAAAALERAARRIPDLAVCRMDALDRSTRLHAISYTTYFPMARIAPWLMEGGYQASDLPFATEPLLPVWDRLNTGALARQIRAFNPTVTICTHFMPAELVGGLIARGLLTTSLSLVVTDYVFHGIWLRRRFSRYFVALDEARARCTAFGVPPERVTVSGIPVDSAFAEPFDRAAAQARYRLRPDTPLVLVSAGAAGGLAARQVVEQLLLARSDVQAIIVCGRNAALQREVAALTAAHADRFRVLGYTDRMPELMQLATLFIGKPGGLTAAECMAAGLPMLLVEPLPGHEDRNCTHLLEEGVAVRCNDLATLAYKLDRVLTEPGRLARMADAARRLGRPDAARTIIETALAERLPLLRLQRQPRRHQLLNRLRHHLVRIVRGR